MFTECEFWVHQIYDTPSTSPCSWVFLGMLIEAGESVGVIVRVTAAFEPFVENCYKLGK